MAVARRTDLDDPNAALLVDHMVDHLLELYPDLDRCAARLDPDDFRPPQGGWILVELEGQPVACGGVRACGAFGQAVAELKRIWVEPSARGSGVSRLLLAQCELLAQALGYREVVLDTGPLQVAAMRLYEASGYRKIPNYGVNAASTFMISFAKSLAPGSAVDDALLDGRESGRVAHKAP